ncbi:MAG: PhnA domain-containing protein [Crocinitomicaceae bacterium]
MTLKQILEERSSNQCELCASKENLGLYSVPPQSANDSQDNSCLICATCIDQIDHPEKRDNNHWRCLNDSMWSEFSPVKVVVYRLLHEMRPEGWTQDLLDMMYMEEADLKWAQSGLLADGEEAVIHKDANGVKLNAGDSIVLIKDLDVKGAGFTAKRGTPVRNISLDSENANHIEGRVNGQNIVILTQYVKKN